MIKVNTERRIVGSTHFVKLRWSGSELVVVDESTASHPDNPIVMLRGEKMESSIDEQVSSVSIYSHLPPSTSARSYAQSIAMIIRIPT